METTNFNATLDCIKETTTFTERIITNVCTGQVSVIPIGFWEFVLIGFVGTSLLVLFVMLLITTIDVFRLS